MTVTLLHIAYTGLEKSEEAREARFGLDERKQEEAVLHLLKSGGYVAVATVDTDDPEQAWSLTQNGGASPSWSREPPTGVVPLGSGMVFGGYGYRSSSVGDIVVANGVAHVAAPFGFRPLGPIGTELADFPVPSEDAAPEPHDGIIRAEIVTDDVVVQKRFDARPWARLATFEEIASVARAGFKGRAANVVAEAVMPLNGYAGVRDLFHYMLVAPPADTGGRVGCETTVDADDLAHFLFQHRHEIFTKLRGARLIKAPSSANRPDADGYETRRFGDLAIDPDLLETLADRMDDADGPLLLKDVLSVLRGEPDTNPGVVANVTKLADLLGSDVLVSDLLADCGPKPGPGMK